MNRISLTAGPLPRMPLSRLPGWLLVSPLGALSLTLLVPVIVLLT